MALTIIHLSDMHLSNEIENFLLNRVDQLCGAIRSIVNPQDHCAVIFTGDITNCGKAEEYNLAIKIVAMLKREIQNHTHKDPPFLFVPGNHDHDFSNPQYDEQMRKVLIDSSTPMNPPSPRIHEILLETQKPYREFVKNISTVASVYAVVDLLESHTLDFDQLTVKFLLLNTTRFTRKKEIAGTSWFPLDKISNHLKEEEEKGGTLNVCLLHHPYNWNRSDNANLMRKLLESRCDVVFTGHEHTTDIFMHSRKKTEQNLYVEGGILQDHDNTDNSSFNIIKVNPVDQKFFCTTFFWNGSLYDQLTEPYEHKYLRLRQALQNELELKNEWENWLQQIGTDFRHQRCQHLTLNDIYVFPDLQKLDIRKACSPRGIVRDNNVVGFIQEKKRVFIAGAEKMGKTSLSKQLFKSLREAGFAPLLLDKTFNIPKGRLTVREKIHAGINEVAMRIYSQDSVTRFWQTRISERAVIVDDYEKIKLGDGGREKLVRWLDENFSLVVLISSPGIRMTEFLQRREGEAILWTFEHTDIKEFDAESRLMLIEKWLKAGTDGFEDTQELYKQKVHWIKIIDNLVDQGALPSLPLFILMIMQQLEAGGTVTGSLGGYGTLYEIIIKDVLKGAAKNSADLEVKLNYLTYFAFELFRKKKRGLSEMAMVEWHVWYCKEFPCQLVLNQVLAEFLSIGVFNQCQTDYGFKYSYYYCFFLARYLSRNLHKEHDAMDIVKIMCSQLYINDFANTMLFLCHMSNHPDIFDLIMNTVRGHFKAAGEYSLVDTPSILPMEMIKPPKLILLTEDPDQEMLKELRSMDDEKISQGLQEIVSAESENIEEKNMIELINNINSAHHTIRICGQLLRNFYGSMRGTEQVNVLKECYALCMRMVTVLYDYLEKDKELIAQNLAEIIQHRFPKDTYENLDNNVRRSLQGIALAIPFGLIKHVALSFGLAALKPGFDKYLREESPTISHQLIDVATRLECYFDVFPEGDVLRIHKELDRGFIGREVLRLIVWEHFSFFKRELKVRQRVCQVLDISATQPLFITAHDKTKDTVKKLFV